MYTSSISDDVRDGYENFVCNDTPIYGIYLLKAHIRYRRPSVVHIYTMSVTRRGLLKIDLIKSG